MESSVPILNQKLLDALQLIETKEEVESYVEKENLLNARDSSKNTLLHLAAQWEKTVMAKYLIESGCTIDAKNDLGQTALMLAIENNSEDVVEILMGAEAEINVQDNHGNNAMQIIGYCDWVTTKILRLFLQKLHVDCSSNKENIAKELSEANWPLIYVVQLNDAELTKIFLQRDYLIDIDKKDFFGQTALRAAVKSVNVDNVKVLLDYNANVNIEDHDGQTPLSYVYDDSEEHLSERHQILKMLLNRAANVVPQGCDVFKYATREAISLLLNAKIGMFDRVMDKLNVVKALSLNKYPKAIEELRGREFFADVIEEGYEMIFLLAASNGFVETLEFVLEELLAVHGESEMLFVSFIRLVHQIRFEEHYKHCVYMFLNHGVNVQLKVDNLDVKSTILEVILEKEYFIYAGLVMSQLALQEMQGLSIDKFTRNLINSNDRLKTSYESSKQRLMIKTYESITLLDLLSASEKKFELYVARIVLRAKIEGTIFYLFSKYYYFYVILSKRLLKAGRMVFLKKNAIPIVSRIMKTDYEKFPFIIDKIVDYFEQQELKKLIESFT